ncbi:MAG: protein translocase subunit SecD [Desulfobacteraceae bacterium]|nr:protein translocase subunit SecD [Desulfobacteraceae bacterium]
MKTLSWRPIVVVVVLVAALIYLLPTLQMIADKKDQATLWPYKKINLGLDLQGGMHLVLQVDTDKAVENTVDRAFDELRAFLKQIHIRPKNIRRIDPTTFALSLAEPEKSMEVKGQIANEFRDYSIDEKTLDGDPAFYLTLKKSEAENIKRLAFEKAVMKVRNRVDEYGAREPDIRPQGENRIVVQLPGIINAERARKEIGRTGHLEFKLVDETSDVSQALKGEVPAGSEIRYYRKDDPEMAGRPILLKKETLLTGDYLSEARVQLDQATGKPYVAIKFNSKGSKIFALVTEENINKRLAIVLDGEVYSAPVIRSKIVGSGIIEGNFNDESARSLALVLREAFPTPVKILYEKSVGPSLGQDSIRKGLISMLVGTLLVVVGMVIYYKWSGVVANIALIADVILLAGGMAAFSATLTLPGIAGVILTLGMAVDGNVLIYERIREELRLGKTARAAMDAGFERATLTILDANVTTLIAALVLFQFGSGPVKGFAVTLSMGVVISVFTVLVLCRAIFEYFLTNRQVKTLSV